MSDEKDIFFVGAGFSKEYGLPLMADLLDALSQFNAESHKFLENCLWLTDEEKKKIQLDTVLQEDLKSINKILSGVDSHIKKDIEKIIHYFDNINKELSKSLLVFMGWVIYLNTYNYFQKTKKNPCDKKDYYQRLLKNKNVIITTNYDNLIEREHPKINTQNFTLPNEFCGWRGKDYPLLLKLHGGHAYIKLNGSEEIKHIYTDENKQFILYREMKNNAGNLGNDQSPHGNPTDEQIIVPPFFNKNGLYDRFKNYIDEIFKVSKDELNIATRIFILGYSLPEADERVIKLLNENIKINEIYIVSPSPLISTGKYLKIFPRGCKYIQMTAGDFVSYYPDNLQKCLEKGIEIKCLNH